MAAGGCRAQVLPPGDPARLAASVGDALCRTPALLLGQVPGPDGRHVARACRRAARPRGAVTARCDPRGRRPGQAISTGRAPPLADRARWTAAAIVDVQHGARQSPMPAALSWA